MITWPGSTAAVTFPAGSPNTSVGVCVLFGAELIPATAPHGPLYGAAVPCLHGSGNCGQIRRTLVAAYRRARIVKDFLESICEAGVALIEDRGIP